MGKVTHRYVNIMNGNWLKELVEQEKRESETVAERPNE